MLLEILGFLRLSFIDILDIVVVALLIYLIFRWLKGTPAMNIFSAILFLLAIRVVAELLNMKLLSSLMGTIVDIGAIALIVIFQPEIRQFLGRVGRGAGLSQRKGGLLGKLFKGTGGNDLTDESITELVTACHDMAETLTGALIVILRTNELSDVIATGDRVNANIKCRLIENIFYKNSPLHDGAMVIGGNRIIAARCTLPMSNNSSLPAKYGMRHKSAVGVTERSDADVIVVSEQRGTISFVTDGKIFPIDNINELRLRLAPKEEDGDKDEQA